MSGIDIDAVRADTPGCREVVHLNNAGAALPPQQVLTACVDYLEAEARTGGYEIAMSRAEDLDRVYQAGANLLGCSADEIAFTTSATESWMKAVQAVPFRKGDRVLATAAEYVANAFGLMRLRNRGLKIDLIPNDEQGMTSVEALENMLDDRVKLVCATHVPTAGGLVNPVAEIGRVAKSAGAYYLLDACQSAGQIPLDVDELQCDFLALTGRKFLRGPRGSGLLYVRSTAENLGDPAVMDGHSAAWTDNWRYEPAAGSQRFETFEYSMAAKVGLGVAIDYALDVGVEAIAKRVEDLGTRLRALLGETPLVKLVEGPGPQSGIVSFEVDGRSSDAVVASLRAWGINMSRIAPQPPAFDPEGRNAKPLIRASVHYYNSDEELVDAVAAL
ncbi:MAG: aminotransferase class V-fold PLP-dependent enzyme [Actinomycetota bacterium]